jgi:UDP-N-acetylmuramate dehydrogenase
MRAVDSQVELRYDRFVGSLRETVPKIKTTLPLLLDEPMAAHTTFRIGGPADFFARPVSTGEAAAICRVCRAEGLPLFVLGAGANILVSDRGIRGLVLDTSRLAAMERRGDTVVAEAGAAAAAVSSFAADCSLSGLEFIFAMPGSVGGAVWMNARCYSVSVSDVLGEVEYLDLAEDPVSARLDARGADFAYKRSPFQGLPCLITRATFRLRPGDRAASLRSMEEHRGDRERKGHFRLPCAGSAFKNDPGFGEPTGRIIDSLGLKGFRVGGAAIAPYHGNIVVNSGGSSAADVLAVLRHAEGRVLEERGIRLEREVLLVGEWDRADTTQ